MVLIDGFTKKDKHVAKLTSIQILVNQNADALYQSVNELNFN